MASRNRRVVWAASAGEALDAAIAFIAAESPAAARNTLARLLATAASLATLSERGSVVPEVPDLAIRQMLSKPYRLIYRVEDERVTILALLHQRQDVGYWARNTERNGTAV
jgi:toxin ParE1/3/4